MPRQPLLPTYQNAKIEWGIAHLDEIPEIATRVGRCVMLWSNVEFQMAMLLSAIMKADAEPSVAVFLALKNARAQREVMIAAAEMELQGETLEAFGAIMNVYKGLSAQRADVAHGIFTGSPDIPDGAPWIASQDFAKVSLRLFQEIRKDHQNVDLGPIKKHAFVYKTDDLDRLYADIKELWEAIFYLWAYLRSPGLALTSALFPRLCALPQIQRELALIRSVEKTQESPS